MARPNRIFTESKDYFVQLVRILVYLAKAQMAIWIRKEHFLFISLSYSHFSPGKKIKSVLLYFYSSKNPKSRQLKSSSEKAKTEKTEQCRDVI